MLVVPPPAKDHCLVCCSIPHAPNRAWHISYSVITDRINKQKSEYIWLNAPMKYYAILNPTLVTVTFFHVDNYRSTPSLLVVKGNFTASQYPRVLLLVDIWGVFK